MVSAVIHYRLVQKRVVTHCQVQRGRNWNLLWEYTELYNFSISIDLVGGSGEWLGIHAYVYKSGVSASIPLSKIIYN